VQETVIAVAKAFSSSGTIGEMRVQDVAARDQRRQVANQFAQRQGKGRVLEPLAGRDAGSPSPVSGRSAIRSWSGVMARYPIPPRCFRPGDVVSITVRRAQPPPPTAAPTTAPTDRGAHDGPTGPTFPAVMFRNTRVGGAERRRCTGRSTPV